jgi:hypothetical protein
MTWIYALYPEDRTDWFLLGWVFACVFIALMERRGESPAVDPDDRPDWAELTDSDLQALHAGDSQTVQTRQGELVRLAAVEEGTDSDE